MFPPSDSIGHQNLKLAEFVTNLQSQAPLPAPPPPYIASHSNIDLFDDDEDDETLALPPIVLKIDTSITIEGQENTVAIPTSVDGGNPIAAEATTQAQPSSTSAGAMQQLQQQRQAKSAQIASSVVTALKACGVLDDIDSGKTRPIEINIDAGIHIKGAKNVVCSGMRKRLDATTLSPSALVTDIPLAGRKRRVQSEPPEQTSSKRAQTMQDKNQ
ncbi:hypothetical protein LOZ12_004148 [Ophidiomyces ophidiicola]|nr:hypothetical protein LOZ62_002552 [Ophidiomyces ophidiicola]KAI1954900.1 hypothetical protein LOZ59_004781 [Ophidiomyces ophidiicola]KAI1969710.1 hypothetical protein LOZ56_004202 [Ophidiomyces ophidiicola]KAI2021277.1 hypothetical protein LOZ45_004824 [Ophidiomyces ophidiicola]KAI2033584.1 hypothetical protein LOZ48_002034 [Ophidiomyces ophidiicola]